MFENWPYSNFHDLNLDWVLRTMREQVSEIQSKVALINANTADINELKRQTEELEDQIQTLIESGFSPSFAGDWDINTAYPKWSLVYVPSSGSSYMAVQNVPAGIPITNTDYWQLTADYNAQFAQIQQELDSINASLASLLDNAELPDVRDTLWLDPHLYVEHKVGDDYYRPQGGVVVKQNNVPYLYTIFFLDNATNDVLAKINMTTGDVVATVTSYNFTHANSMAYSPDTDTLYIAGGAGGNNLYRINASSMSYLGVTALPHPVNMVAFWDHKLWACTSIADHTIYTYAETDLSTVIDTINIDPGNSLWNDMYINDDYIFFTTLRDTDNSCGVDGIAVYYHSGAIKGWSILPTSIEIESISEIDGEFFCTLYTSYGMLGAYVTPVESLKAVNRFLRSKPRRIATSLTNTRVYLDSTYTGNLVDGSQAYPYRRYAEMIQCSYYTGYADLSIYVTGEFPNVFTFEHGNMNRTIHIVGTGNGADAIGGFIGYNGNYDLQNLTINDYPVVDGNQANVNLYNSTATIEDCTLNTPNSQQGYGVYCNKTNLSLANTEFNTYKGAFSNLGSNIRVGEACTFNCTSNYLRIYKTGAIRLDGVPIDITTKLIENTSAEPNLTGTILLASADNFGRARTPGIYLAQTAPIARTITGVPASTSAFMIEVKQTLNQNNLVAEYYCPANGERWINYFTSGAWKEWVQYSFVEPEVVETP